MRPRELDHIALWVEDRDAITTQLCDQLNVRVIDRTERYTLIGPDAHAGKVTLFDAPGGRAEAYRLVSLLLADPARSGREPLVLPGGLTVTFGMHARVGEDVAEHSLIGLTLRASDPVVAAADYCARFGFEAMAAHRDVTSVGVGSGVITLVREEYQLGDAPMLNHLGLLVDSAQDHLRRAEDQGIEVLDVVDAPNTLAVFLSGPEQVRLEYVEHKPEFALT